MLPGYVKKYFWGDDLKGLSWEKHRDYISKTILEKGDSKSLRWLLGQASKNYLMKINFPRPYGRGFVISSLKLASLRSESFIPRANARGFKLRNDKNRHYHKSKDLQIVIFVVQKCLGKLFLSSFRVPLQFINLPP